MGYIGVITHLLTYLLTSWDIQVGFQTPCEEVIRPQKPTQKTFSAAIWKTRVLNERHTTNPPYSEVRCGYFPQGCPLCHDN